MKSSQFTRPTIVSLCFAALGWAQPAAVRTETLQTADQLAVILGELELYGLGRDEVDNFFARKYYKRDNPTYVLLGNAAKIRGAAGKYAPKLVEISVIQPGFGGR